jgi:serine/threonine protein kinase
MSHSAPPSGFSARKRHIVGAPVIRMTPASARSYQPMLRLATGGMGSVYLGYQSSLAGPMEFVAIKRVHAHLAADGRLPAMLRAEAEYMAEVRHPNVVRFIELTTVEGEQALVMEYVEGASAAQLATGTGMPTAIALRVALDACAGLAAIHEAGLLHRDLSPGNVIVGVDGVARVADFGVAQRATDKQGGLYGKLGYMAPEYLTLGLASNASDVFALGVVIRELLEASPEYAAALEPIVERALSPDPQARHSANELMVALEGAGQRLATPYDVGMFVEQASRPAVKGAPTTRAVTGQAPLATMISPMAPASPRAPSPLAMVGRPLPMVVAVPTAKPAASSKKIVALAAFALFVTLLTSAFAQWGLA